MVGRYNSAILQAPHQTMTDGPDFSEIGKSIAALGAAVGGLWLMVRKMINQHLKLDLDDSKSKAWIEIIDGLRLELERLTAQNTTLADSLNELQVEIIELRAENARLRVTIEGLNVEVETLRKSNEVSGFDRLGA